MPTPSIKGMDQAIKSIDSRLKKLENQMKLTNEDNNQGTKSTENLSNESEDR